MDESNNCLASRQPVDTFQLCYHVIADGLNRIGKFIFQRNKSVVDVADDVLALLNPVHGFQLFYDFTGEVFYRIHDSGNTARDAVFQTFHDIAAHLCHNGRRRMNAKSGLESVDNGIKNIFLDPCADIGKCFLDALKQPLNGKLPILVCCILPPFNDILPRLLDKADDQTDNSTTSRA